MDASNQTESPVEESEGEELPEEVPVKEENNDTKQNTSSSQVEDNLAGQVQDQEPDMSGLNLLCCVAYQSRNEPELETITSKESKVASPEVCLTLNVLPVLYYNQFTENIGIYKI